MAREDSQHAPADQMLFTKLGDPLPRQLPDGRVIIRSDLVATLNDKQAAEWLDGIEQYEPETTK